MRQLHWLILGIFSTFCALPAFPQASCPQPGTMFNESFNASSPCGFGGVPQCNNLWSVTGTSAAAQIVPSPAGSPWCNNALEITANATPAVLKTSGSLTTIPVATTVDIYFETYVIAQPNSLSGWFGIFDEGLVQPLVQIQWSSGTQIKAFSSTSSAAITVSLNSSHLIHCHLDATAANSYLQVDGGTTQGFTAFARTANQIVIGGTGNTTGTYYIGNLYLNSSAGTGQMPMLNDFSAGTNGNPIAAADMNSSTHCGNNAHVGWTVPTAGMTYSNALFHPLLTPVNSCGAVFAGNSGLSIKYDLNTSDSTYWSYITTSTSVSFGIWFNLSVPSTNTNFIHFATVFGGLDYAGCHEHGTGSQLQMYMETKVSGISGETPINISPNTWYWCSIQYNSPGQHHMAIFSATGTLLGTITSPALASSNPLGKFIFGHSGSDQVPGASIYFSNPVTDWVNAQFPLGPTFGGLQLNPQTVAGGFTSVGTVALPAPAPAGGTTVTLSSSNTAVATVPASELIPAGSSSTTFTINTSSVSSAASSNISATYSGATNIATLAVLPVNVSPQYSIWSTSSGPTVSDDGGTSATEVGVKFTADTPGFISGILFYKSAANTGSHVGNLWTSTGQLLATATFTGETSSGWQRVNFASPIAVTPNTIYVASYHTNTGHTSDDNHYFTSIGVNNSPLHAPASGASGGNGVLALNLNSVFPNTTNLDSNYWVDVLFLSSSSSSAVIQSLTLNPTTVTGGTPSTGTVTLTAAAPSGGAVVTLSSSITSAATVPASVTVAAGATSATFTVTSLPVGATASPSISATFNGTASATLTVRPPAVLSVTLNPTTVTGGTPSTGTVTLTAAAPSGGAVVTLSSSITSAATVPASVTVAAGATSEIGRASCRERV